MKFQLTNIILVSLFVFLLSVSASTLQKRHENHGQAASAASYGYGSKPTSSESVIAETAESSPRAQNNNIDLPSEIGIDKESLKPLMKFFKDFLNVLQGSVSETGSQDSQISATQPISANETATVQEIPTPSLKVLSDDPLAQLQEQSDLLAGGANSQAEVEPTESPDSDELPLPTLTCKNQ